jgi:hypothetical protein
MAARSVAIDAARAGVMSKCARRATFMKTRRAFMKKNAGNSQVIFRAKLVPVAKTQAYGCCGRALGVRLNVGARTCAS